ncbi:hypothetical protein [Veillonella caviae]|uniref:hypothetical protein n=1 Tax=Veillonella caviae TaxID=248316 RepID=UPI0023F8AC61|nr:hypothetical protein [Veillonella caviae]MCI7693556.1 hypothetical protein [Veillonella caviae]MDY5253180.1 hypothetical protein [Veillonella caviae]
MKEIKGKLEIKINPKLKEHMEKIGDKNQDLLNAIEVARSDGFNVVIDRNSLEHDNRLSVDEAVNNLAKTFIQMQSIMDRVVIEDAWYTKAFGEEVENALITMAVIKAFGIGKKSECYLGVVKKVVRELKTAPSKG